MAKKKEDKKSMSFDKPLKKAVDKIFKKKEPESPPAPKKEEKKEMPKRAVYIEKKYEPPEPKPIPLAPAPAPEPEPIPLAPMPAPEPKTLELVVEKEPEPEPVKVAEELPELFKLIELQDYTKIAELLQKERATSEKITPKTKFCTPLTFAVIKKDIKMIKFLVEKGINIDEQDICGDTAVNLSPTEEIMVLLIELGANPRIKNIQGKDAFSVASEMGWAKAMGKIHG